MHHYSRYLCETKAENEARALADCKEYLGDEFYDKVIRTLRSETKGKSVRYAYHMIRFSLSMFVGIEGYYPVRAMVREVLK